MKNRKKTNLWALLFNDIEGYLLFYNWKLISLIHHKFYVNLSEVTVTLDIDSTSLCDRLITFPIVRKGKNYGLKVTFDTMKHLLK